MENQKNLFEEFPPVSTSQWEEVILKDLKGADYNKKLVWQTLDGIALQPYYRMEDLADINHLSEENVFASLRTRNADNRWEIFVRIEDGSLAKANGLVKEYILNGANSFLCNAENIKSTNDLSVLFDGISIADYHFSFINTGCARVLRNILAEYIQQHANQKVNFRIFKNPLEDLITNGSFKDGEEGTFIRIHELIKRTNQEMHGFKVCLVDGSIFHNAGASASQELAYSLASANDIIQKLINHGLSIDDIAPHMFFKFAVSSDYFPEIAKLRAARILWAALIDAYQAKKQESGITDIIAETSLYNKSIYDPYTNMLRLTTEAMSAIIGGADMVHVQPFDMSYKEPDEFSKRIAKNVHLVLREEAYFDKVLDPSAGSFYIENVTNELVNKSWDLFKTIESKGGFIEQFKKGKIQEQIAETDQQRKKDLIRKKENMLGTTIFPNTNEKIIDKIAVQPVSDKKGVYPKLQIQRKAEAFEQLRLKTEQYAQNGGKIPSVFMIPFGSPAMASARQIFSRNFFGCSGFEIIENARFKNSEEIIQALEKSHAEIVVLCSADEDYLTQGVEIARIIKSKFSGTYLVLAGQAGENKELFEKAGIDDFVNMRTNIIESLQNIQKLFSINA